MTYETSDLYFAAYVLTHGVKLGSTRQTGARLIFVFSDGEAASDLYVKWLNESDPLPSARAYADRVKQLKHLVMSAR